MPTSPVPTTPRATTGRRTSAAIALLFSAALLAATGAAAATCPTCDDGNPCTDDLCDVNQTCVHAANSAACNDGSACTTGDVCNAGSCVGGAPAAGCTACQAEAVIAPEGGSFTGTTSGASSLTGTCSSTAGSPERVYRWTPARSGPAVIETCGTGTGFDTVLYLRTGSCAAGQTIGCNDDIAGCAIASGASLGSRLTPTVTAGQTYWIVVDGYQGKSGPYTLRVIPPTVCGNGIREGAEQCDGADASGCVTGQCTTACTCVAPTGGLPDLQAEIADVSVQRNAVVSAGDVTEGCAEATSGVDLLRFSVRSRNAGTADFALGNPMCPSPCDEHPLEVCANPQFVCSPAEGHNHAHYNNYARYELLDAASQAVVVGHKQGFCLLDSLCAAPKYTCQDQGISAGCADVYSASLGCQYLDITGVAAGNYVLRVTVDPFNRIAELSETNNVAFVPVTLAGGSTTTTVTPTTTTTTSTTVVSACAGVTTIPTAGGSFTGTTSGPSTLTASCASTASAPERVFAWTPGRSGVATIETCSTTVTQFDTVLSVRLGACSGGVEIGCNDNTNHCGTSAHPNRGSRIRPNVTAGQTYFIVVDGTQSNPRGNFQLRVVPPL